VDRVIIGVDPHKLSVTIEARDTREILRATGRFGTDARSYRQLLAYARQWPERRPASGRLNIHRSARSCWLRCLQRVKSYWNVLSVMTCLPMAERPHRCKSARPYAASWCCCSVINPERHGRFAIN
jgi:hypothetical protein